MKIEQEALTFDDVLLTPCYSNVLPKDVSLKTNLTRKIELNIPLVSAAMDTVTEARLAIALAELGGLGILHKSMTLENQALEVRKVKKFESGVVLDPITVKPDTTVQEIMNIRREYNISGMPVVDGDVLVGIVTNRDIRFAEDLSQTAASLMTPKDRLITVKEDVSREESIALFREHRVEKLLIVDDAHRLKGMITVKDIMRSKHNPQACRNDSGQLRVAAAVGTGPDTMDRVDALIEAGVDLIVVDTAHGHSEGVLQTVRNVRAAHRDCQLVAGNIVTKDAAEALIKAGVDALKVGVGPGSICTTRIIAGVGVPQISAIADVAAVAAKQHIPVIADGGIRFSGDVSKALAAGASVVMIGGLFAGTEEAPGEVVLYQGRSYKSYRGMGSLGAMAQKHGSSDRYFQDKGQTEQKYVPEGIEGRVPYKGPLSGVVHQLTGGLRSSMGYTGSATIKEHSEKARFVKITNAGSKESHVHDVTITKEAPNYTSEPQE